MTGTGPQASILPDGRRLHLNHGPIDLIIEVFGPERDVCYDAAIARFKTLLTNLVQELPDLRCPVTDAILFNDPVARRMAQAVAPFDDVFVTPMAAVAGAVADEVLAAMTKTHSPSKAYVNNGGDIAFHLMPGESLVSHGPAGAININQADPERGLATSGWTGRSHSLGIADAVTVVAKSAAQADVAATLIANAVDLPGHPTITRHRASALNTDSDLGDLLVTTAVGDLPLTDIHTALSRGAAYARQLCARGLISQASLSLQGQTRTVSMPFTPAGVSAHV